VIIALIVTDFPRPDERVRAMGACSWVLGTLFVEHVLGYGAWDTGLAFLPMTLTVGALSLGTTARVMARLGAERTVLVGLAFVVAALLLLTAAGASTASALTGGYHLGFEIAAAAVAVGILVSLAVLRVPAREEVRPAGSELAVEL
jgi:hypothetical protein